MFDRRVGFTFGHAITLGKQFEMVDQRFHVVLHLHAGRRHNLLVADHDRAGIFPQPGYALPDDLVGLTHFLHPDQVAIVTIAIDAYRYIEVDPIVNFVGLFLAQVPFHPRASEHGAGESQLPGPLRRNNTDVDGPLLPDPVIGQQSLVFIDASRKPVAKRIEEIEHRAFAVHIQTLDFFCVSDFFNARETGHFLRQIAIDTTGTIVVRVHPGTRDRFITIHQVFAFAEAIQEYGHRPNIEPVRPKPHQVIQQAGDFIEHHADILRTYRRRDAHQFFDRQYVTVLVAHHRYIVQTIHITDGLVVRLAFGEFFGGPVQEADMRIGL
ncbi:hypothetical protein MnTg04_00566 [bacterium MnTg04]|nr:hypothetical protein MnTg04_00566 [bacterium MnTg04]